MSGKNGGPAFPVRMEGPNLTSWQEVGMTLRDYFAAKYMQGYMANPDVEFDSRQEASEQAYAMADAMIVERDK